MEKYPFTPAGVQDMQTALYALSDPQLELEAEVIENDFAAWVSDTFDLDSTQLSFLGNLNGDFLNSCGLRTALAVRHRLPIYLVEAEQQNAHRLNSEKTIRKCDRIDENGNGSGQYTATGSLTYKIEYP
jgi:hypothetical protein